MLITKEVGLKLSPKIINRYEDLGYKIPRRLDTRGVIRAERGLILKVKVEDLPDGSGALVNIKCDACEKELPDISWCTYVKEDGSYYCQKCANNGDKKYISFYEWCYIYLSKEEADEILLRWDYNLNINNKFKSINPKEVSYGSNGFNKKGYWFKCLDHPEHKSEQKYINHFTKGQKGSLECNQCNTISITHPELDIFLVNKEDSLKYPAGYNKKIPVRCPNCGFEKDILIRHLINNGFACSICSDGIPYPERFMSCVLTQLEVIFKVQLSKTTFMWCGKYKYDNYINEINCIIETHGRQHYIESKGKWGSLEVVQKNDTNKLNLANKNGISNYIVIDCRISDIEFIKNSIMNSRLPELLNFKEEDIDWLKCHKDSCISAIKETCDYWNNGIKNTSEIAKLIKVDRVTIVRYLSRGKDIGWCDYDPIRISESHLISMSEENCKKVICLTTGEIFNSQTEAENKYNICGVSSCCRKIYKSVGTHPETGEKLIWMFYDEYLTNNQTYGWLNNYLNNYNYDNKTSKVICLTTNEIFNSHKEANAKYNIDKSRISSCCRGKSQSVGEHPITKEPLKWMYYDEYLTQN